MEDRVSIMNQGDNWYDMKAPNPPSRFPPIDATKTPPSFRPLSRRLAPPPPPFTLSPRI